MTIKREGIQFSIEQQASTKTTNGSEGVCNKESPNFFPIFCFCGMRKLWAGEDGECK